MKVEENDWCHEDKDLWDETKASNEDTAGHGANEEDWVADAEGCRAQT